MLTFNDTREPSCVLLTKLDRMHIIKTYQLILIWGDHLDKNCCKKDSMDVVTLSEKATPSNQGQPEEKSCCSCGDEITAKKKTVVEYLYLDLQTCDRCIGTDTVLDEVMLRITSALECTGYTVEYKKIEMETAEIAKQYRFLSSPTIRVNGQDICQSVTENSCGCCSDISGTDIDCRVFAYNGESYEIPPKEMLAEAILRAVFGQADSVCSCGGYELPSNLKDFFKGKESKSACSCGGGC